MWSFLSPIISGLALMWAIYTFIIAKKEKAAEKERQTYIDLNKETRDRFEHDTKELKREFEKQMAEFEKMKTRFAQQSERLRISDALLKENYTRMEKVLDRHEKKLDDFGKVIIK